jgi:hypothetical protein
VCLDPFKSLQVFIECFNHELWSGVGKIVRIFDESAFSRSSNA